jgi:hypothetical protein
MCPENFQEFKLISGFCGDLMLAYIGSVFE